ncbi:flippase-like domain-containing protein, partial [bacterium]
MDNSNQSTPAVVQPRQRIPWLRWAGTIVALGLLVYLLTQQGWDEFANAIQAIPAWAFLAAFACLFASRLTTIGRWLTLLRSAEVDISARDAFKLVFAGLFASNFLPTTIGGDVVRLAGALQLRLDAGIVTASLIVDRLVGMAGMATLLPLELPRVLREGLPALQGTVERGPN